MRLATRIGLGFAVSIAALALVVLATMLAFRLVRAESAKVFDNHIPSIEAAARLTTLLERMDNLEYLYLSARRDREGWLRQFDETSVEFDAALGQAEEVVTAPDEVVVYNELGRQYGVFLHIHGRIRELAAAGRWSEARALNASESLAAEAEFRRATLRFLRLNLDAASRAKLVEQRVLALAEAFAVSVALAGALLAGWLWRRAARDIVEPLEHLRWAAGQVLAGRPVGPGHPGAAKTEEIAALQAEVRRMAEDLQATAAALRTANADLESTVQARTAALVAANERLETVIAELKTLDRLKSDFLATTSHELLTPLAFIVGFASSLEDELLGPLTDRQRDAVGKLLAGAERLTRMVRNTIEYSQAAAGELAVYNEAVGVTALVRELADGFAEAAEAAGLTLAVDAPDDVPAAWADPDRTAQAAAELLDNAIKFTPTGGRVDVRVRSDGAWVVVEVADTGPGIPPDAIDRLYQPFFQVDSSRTRAHGGLGLGLPLAHLIARRMGGELQVRSRVGCGTTFRLLLPLADHAAAAPPGARVASIAFISDAETTDDARR